MIEWRDEGVLLRVRPHGESSAIIDVFTPSRGRAAGIVRGGTSRKTAAILQPGTQLDVAWKARLQEHLGTFTVEPIRSRAAVVMADRLALAGLNAVTALLAQLLAEQEPHGALYDRSVQLLDLLGQNDVWPLAYLQWEMALLEDLGFALDLRTCAATGAGDDLVYVSPRTGRAVSRHGAGDWANKLLPLPPVMLGQGDANNLEIAKALGTTGHFLTHHVAPSMGSAPVPDARGRLLDAIRKLD